MALVREYAQSNSEQAFATLASRHINLVYSVALRQVGDSHLAEEIAQGVFIILAKKAKSLGPKTIISGWLCRTARYVSAHALRDQRRRQFREQEAHMESILNEPEPGVWNQIAPLLDEALNCLGEKEHDAVVLRFFDGKELNQVGAAMGTTEDAARMRVNRGVEKLRDFFTKKGVTLSVTAITGAVAANSVQTAPAGLAANITAAALSGTTITTTAVLAATKAIAMTALQKTLVVVTVVAASLATPLVIQHQSQTRLRAENQTLRAQIAQLNQLDTESVATSPTTNSALPVAKEQFNELLRLRGQVGVLRRQLAEALKSDSTQKLAPKTAEPTTNADVPLSSLPILQPAFTAWQQGDASTAVRSFLAVDWSARPLFAAGSPLSLSDDQMHALRAYSEADYEAKSREVITELAQLKHLAKAVEEAGRDTASKGDVAQARKDFTSLKQFGTALDSPDYVQIVQLVGRASKKMSDIELARIGQ